MAVIERYKAAIITFLLTGILVMGLFSIELKQQSALISESYYEIEPEPEKLEEELLKNDFEDDRSPSSNKAFNEDEEYKELMRNFKTISANDFEETTKALEAAKADNVVEDISDNNSISNNTGYAINSKETESYKQLEERLNKRLENKKVADEHANTKSSLTYSLIGRVLEYYKTPRYLCEEGGKIVVSIKVDSEGNVFEASVNGASNSNNQCLIDSAIDYAKTARFNTSTRQNQLGTITFLFKGKN